MKQCNLSSRRNKPRCIKWSYSKHIHKHIYIYINYIRKLSMCVNWYEVCIYCKLSSGFQYPQGRNIPMNLSLSICLQDIQIPPVFIHIYIYIHITQARFLHDVQFSCAITQPLLAHHWRVHQCLLTSRFTASLIPWGASAPGGKMRKQLFTDHKFLNNSPILSLKVLL